MPCYDRKKRSKKINQMLKYETEKKKRSKKINEFLPRVIL